MPDANRAKAQPPGMAGRPRDRIHAFRAHPKDVKAKVLILQMCIIGVSVNHCRFKKKQCALKSVDSQEFI